MSGVALQSCDRSLHQEVEQIQIFEVEQIQIFEVEQIQIGST